MRTLKATNKIQFSQIKLLSTVVVFFILTLLFSTNTMAQEKIQMVRLGKLKLTHCNWKNTTTH
jgi:hypothetical protein